MGNILGHAIEVISYNLIVSSDTYPLLFSFFLGYTLSYSCKVNLVSGSGSLDLAHVISIGNNASVNNGGTAAAVGEAQLVEKGHSWRRTFGRGKMMDVRLHPTLAMASRLAFV
jgi:hypothetical protein